MLAENEPDEAWRVLDMFAAETFNYRLADFPLALQRAYRQLGPVRQRNYGQLLAQIAGLDAGLRVDTVGVFRQHSREYRSVKLVCAPPPAPHASVMPIAIVAGIHGDEPDSVFGALELARRFVRSAELRRTYALTVYPCLNPVGYEHMTRENGTGLDLNREFFRDSREPEVQLMERELAAQQFVGLIALHSDYESFGLYAYAAGAVLSERLAKPALFQASGIVPINTDPVIDGHPAQHGIINKKYPGALGPLTKGNIEPFDITIETPNLFALRKRVEAHATAAETVLHEYRALAAEAMYL